VCVGVLLLQLKDVTEQITQLTEAIKAASAAVGECCLSKKSAIDDSDVGLKSN